ncbi:MAG: methyltransferase domain-containing protein [Planctomycetes bacterium]|nr:methyltransferase domain-containing protein [Planctomycetota bacterium]
MSEIQRERYDENYFAAMVAEARDLPEPLARKLAHWFEFVGQPLVPGALAIDTGCGAGTIAHFLTKRGLRVVALDAFEHPCRLGRAALPAIPFAVGNLDTGLPFRDASVDLVVSHEVVEHLHRPQVFFDEAFRVLRPGGSVVVKTPNRLDWYRFADPLFGREWYADADKTHLRYFSQFDLARMLRKAGFDVAAARAGTKPFFRKWHRWRKWWNPRLPVFGNASVARGVKPA